MRYDERQRWPEAIRDMNIGGNASAIGWLYSHIAALISHAGAANPLRLVNMITEPFHLPKAKAKAHTPDFSNNPPHIGHGWPHQLAAPVH